MHFCKTVCICISYCSMTLIIPIKWLSQYVGFELYTLYVTGTATIGHVGKQLFQCFFSHSFPFQHYNGYEIFTVCLQFTWLSNTNYIMKIFYSSNRICLVNVLCRFLLAQSHAYKYDKDLFWYLCSNTTGIIKSWCEYCTTCDMH